MKAHSAKIKVIVQRNKGLSPKKKRYVDMCGGFRV